jgi:hypothetical protein
MGTPRGPSVRDVMIYGYETFPAARRDWIKAITHDFPTVNDIVSCYIWCDENFGHPNWYRAGNTFYFDNEIDACLFKMRYC